MENISLKSIKLESIRGIFRSISSSERVSRATIAEQTGLSLMTVGKVADALLSMNVLVQDKETKTTAGRRAGLLSVNPANFAAVLDLTSPRFTLTIINMCLDVEQKYRYSYREEFNLRDNLKIFLKEARLFIERNYLPANCIGCGVSVPGPYFPDTDRVRCCRMPELSEIPLAALINEAMNPPLLFIEASYNAAAISNIASISDAREKVILYWFIGDDDICGTLINRGEIVRGAHNAAGNFGQMIVARGITLDAAIKPEKTREENAYELAKAIHNVIHVVDPDQIIIECEMYKNNPIEFVDMTRRKLTENFSHAPETMPGLMSGTCKFRHSHRGLTLHLREMWLYDLIMNGSV